MDRFCAVWNQEHTDIRSRVWRYSAPCVLFISYCLFIGCPLHSPPFTTRHSWLCLIAPPILPDCWTLSYCRFKPVALIVMCRDVEELQSSLLALFTLQCCMLYAPAGSWFVLVCTECKTATSSGEMTLCIASSLSRFRVWFQMTSSLLDVDDVDDTLPIFTPLPNRVLTSPTDTSYLFLINLISLSALILCCRRAVNNVSDDFPLRHFWLCHELRQSTLVQVQPLADCLGQDKGVLRKAWFSCQLPAIHISRPQ